MLPLFCAASLACAQTVADKPESSAVQLSPFLVSESETQGYYASSSLAGTRLKSDLRDLASSVQVVTREFMDDVGAVSANTLLQYTTSTETAGIQGNFAGTIARTADQMTTGDARQNSEATNRVRGLGSPDQTRGYFKTDIPFDGYNTQRVDINRGANSFLFGLGSPAGLINTSLTLAEFKNSHEVVTRVGSGGDRSSYRGSFNFNRQLIDKVLALRVAGLVDRTQYRQEPTFRDDDRGYAAVTYRPLKYTTFRAHYEKGKVNGNPPEVLLPQENLSTSFNEPIVGRMAVDVVANMRATNNIEGAFNNRPTAALLADLKQRGLLEDTLVVWCTEFGRMPFLQANGTGRDHNPDAFTCFLMGAGVKPGFSFGASDNFGFKAVQDKTTLYDFNATILHLLGLDHERLTYYHNGLERRLTDVHGHVIKQVLA